MGERGMKHQLDEVVFVEGHFGFPSWPATVTTFCFGLVFW